jgi:23S rRNA pseudouridine955/2504/2580 synthase
MPPAELDPDWILFHGSGVLAINKPAGVPVHAGTGHEVGLTEMIDAFVRMNPGTLEIKPGNPVHPVHRLDLEATGVLLFGLAPAMARSLHAAFEAGEVKKRYLAVLAAEPAAELEFRRLAGDEWLSLVEVSPVGGRTPNLRALFAAAGRPLAGDARYGKPKASQSFLEKMGVAAYLLHARELTLPGSILGAPKRIEAPPPPDLVRLLELKSWTLPTWKESA